MTDSTDDVDWFDGEIKTMAKTNATGSRTKRETYLAPEGTAQYAFVTRPAEYNGEQSYKITVLWKAADKAFQSFYNGVKSTWENHLKSLGIKPKASDFNIFRKSKTQAGYMELTFKTKVFDNGDGTQIPVLNADSEPTPGQSVWSNDKVRVGYQINLYKPTKLGCGISLRPKAVQVTEAAERERGTADYSGLFGGKGKSSKKGKGRKANDAEQQDDDDFLS